MIARILLTTLMLVSVGVSSSYSGDIGRRAPTFELPDARGRPVSLESFSGKVVFLNFWTPWCVSCRVELPELETLYRKYRKAGLEVIGIGLDASEAAVAKFLQRTPLSFPVLLDRKGRVADAYRFSGLPASFIVGRDGVIRHRHVGFEKHFVQMYAKEIEELLKQQ